VVAAVCGVAEDRPQHCMMLLAWPDHLCHTLHLALRTAKACAGPHLPLPWLSPPVKSPPTPTPLQVISRLSQLRSLSVAQPWPNMAPALRALPCLTRLTFTTLIKGQLQQVGQGVGWRGQQQRCRNLGCATLRLAQRPVQRVLVCCCCCFSVLDSLETAELGRTSRALVHLASPQHAGCGSRTL
jgi:hypothetical protein